MCSKIQNGVFHKWILIYLDTSDQDPSCSYIIATKMEQQVRCLLSKLPKSEARRSQLTVMRLALLRPAVPSLRMCSYE